MAIFSSTIYFPQKGFKFFGKTDMDYLDILKNTQKVLYFARDTNHLHQVYDLTWYKRVEFSEDKAKTNSYW